MKSLALTLLLTFITLAQCSKVCLISGTTTLTPVSLNNPVDCPRGDPRGCMAEIYKYRNFKYNGVPQLAPPAGNIYMYLTQDSNGDVDFVMMINPVYSSNVLTTIQLVGVEPTTNIIVDDITEGSWNSTTNTGTYNFKVEPGYTDGVVVGHLKFVDNYCVKANFVPIKATGITSVHVITGTATTVTSSTTVNFVSGVDFEFCQYPVLSVTKKDIDCTPGSAKVSVVSGASPYIYTWENEMGNVVSNTDSLLMVQNAGSYKVTVDSNDGCTAQKMVSISSSPAPLSISSITTMHATDANSNGWAHASVLGGSAPYLYEWTDSGSSVVSTMANATSLSPGVYSLEVQDSCGATVTGSATIEIFKICQAGGYYDRLSDMCVVCPPGSYTSMPGQLSCIQCKENEYTRGGNDPCSRCPTSSFSTIGSGMCTPCPAGTQRSSSSSSCSPCREGYYRCATVNFMCVACPAGTYSTLGSSDCLPCQPGYYNDKPAQSACTICPVNTYSTGGQSTCTACLAGNAPQGSTDDVACGLDLINN